MSEQCQKSSPLAQGALHLGGGSLDTGAQGLKRRRLGGRGGVGRRPRRRRHNNAVDSSPAGPCGAGISESLSAQRQSVLGEVIHVVVEGDEDVGFARTVERRGGGVGGAFFRMHPWTAKERRSLTRGVDTFRSPGSWAFLAYGRQGVVGSWSAGTTRRPLPSLSSFRNFLAVERRGE